MSKLVAVRVPDDVYSYISKKPNISRYLLELIKQDVYAQQITPIALKVKSELMADSDFFGEVAFRVSSGVALNQTPITGDTVTSKQPIQPIQSVTAGMERGCCSGAKPCQHWQFNGEDTTWVNTLSGRVREA